MTGLEIPGGLALVLLYRAGRSLSRRRRQAKYQQIATAFGRELARRSHITD